MAPKSVATEFYLNSKTMFSYDIFKSYLS